MTAKKQTPFRTRTLEEVKHSFDNWRSTRSKLGKIPETLWQQVLGLSSHYSNTVICKTLGVNNSQLSQHVPTHKPKLAQEQSQFVQIPIQPNYVGASGMTATIIGNDGARLELKDLNEQAFNQLIQIFKH